MVYNSNMEFYDHSTLAGKVSMYLNRLNWKYVSASILIVGLVTVGLLVATSSSGIDDQDAQSSTKLTLNPISNPISQKLFLSPTSTPEPTGILRKSTTFRANAWNPNKVSPPGTFESEGCENGLMVFDGFGSIEKASIKSLKLRDLIIDAPTLTKELDGWTSLESITIENAWMNGEFGRVYLPNLNKFIYHQFHNAKTDTYKLKDKLKSILFFDKVQGQTWDIEKDLLNLNVTMQVTIGGTKIIDIEPELGEILINTHYCEDILKNLEGVFPVSILSLNWCSVTNASIHKIPKDLKYIQFNNAVPNNDDLSTVIRSVSRLTEFHAYLRFHCEWPGYEIFLNISELPQSTEIVSVTNLDISFTPGMVSPIKSLSIGDFVTPKVVDQFENIFVNLESIAIFNLTASSAYPLLEKVIKTQIEWILVTNLTRAIPKSKDFAMPSIKVVEKFLLQAQIPKTGTNFLMELKNGTYSGRCLTDLETNYYRYIRLAFNKQDTYEDYMMWDALPV